jgi:multicomponent Na+:H+ antiporter subunit D
VPFPVFASLLGAGVSTVFVTRPAVQRVVAVTALGASTAVSIAMLVLVERDGPAATTLGGWPAAVGVTLVVDVFSALVLAVAMVTVFAVLLYAIGQPGVDDEFPFHPVYLVLTAGIALTLVTGDLFTLFVGVELMLAASYALLTQGGRSPQVRTGMTYVVINTVASSLLVSAIGLIYAATGTVNIADLAGKLGHLDPGLRTALGAYLLLVFGIKAAVVPLFFWLPDSYPTAPTPVTAVFAGLLTKIGVYAIARTSTLLFPGDEVIRNGLLAIGTATMLVGVLGAIAQDDMKRILSFHIVSQIGYMVFGVGIATRIGLAAAIFFLLHQIPVKASLFCVTGIVEHHAGTAALHRLGGLRARAPALAAMFGLAAASLAGLPPTSGFVGKLGLVSAGFASHVWIPTAASLVVSILTLLSMLKIWNGVFWGEPDEPPPNADVLTRTRLRAPALMTSGTAMLVAVTVAVAVFAGPLFSLCERAADGLLSPASYQQVVLR